MALKTVSLIYNILIPCCLGSVVLQFDDPKGWNFIAAYVAIFAPVVISLLGSRPWLKVIAVISCLFQLGCAAFFFDMRPRGDLFASILMTVGPSASLAALLLQPGWHAKRAAASAPPDVNS